MVDTYDVNNLAIFDELLSLRKSVSSNMRPVKHCPAPSNGCALRVGHHREECCPLRRRCFLVS